MNYHNNGGTWIIHGVSRAQILSRMAPVQQGAPALWNVVLDVLDDVGLSAEADPRTDRERTLAERP